MIEARSGIAFEALAQSAVSGLVGQITVRVYDPATGANILPATTAGITEPAPGTYRATLTIAQAGSYIVRWTQPDGLAAEELVSVVGPLFTLADARRDGLIPVARATDAQVLEAGERAERQLEEACRVALIRKTATHEGIIDARGVLALPHRQAPWAPDPIVIVSSAPATPAGALRTHRWGAISGWTTGEGSIVTATYQHGPLVPPARAMTAALTLARSQLLEGPIDSRALGIAVEGGGSIGLATPGLRGATFGIPEVDAFILQFGVGRRV